MNFAQVESEYRRLKAQVAAGQISEDEFKAKLQELMIQDEQGHWWVIGFETGQWYVHDGVAWVPAQPPSQASSSEAPAAETKTEPVVSPPVASPVQKQPAAPSGRKLWPWLALALLVVGIVAVLMLRLLASQAAEPEAALLPTQEPAAVVDASAATVPTATFAVPATRQEKATPTPIPTGDETAVTATAESSLKVQAAAAQARAAADTAKALATAEAAVAPAATVTIEPTAQPTDTPEPTAVPAPTSTVPPKPTATIAPTPTVALSPTAAPLPTRAPPAATTQPGMIFNFEELGAWRRGDEPYGSFTQSSEQKHSGSYAGKLSYDFPAVQNNYVVFLRLAPLPIPEQLDALTLWVIGDGSGHFLNAWIRDAQGEVRQFTFGQVNHKDSWQPMMLRLDTAAPWPQGHISGPDNGRLDFPISLEALVLDGVPDGAASMGVLYLDDLMSGPRSGANLPASAPGKAAASVVTAVRPAG
jgi:hypothetical protein